VGGLIGSATTTATGGGAIAAGLAALGGGSVASGGLGIAGGIAVLSAVGDLGLAVALDGVAQKFDYQNNPHTFLSAIKLSYFRDRSTKQINQLIDDIYEDMEQQQSGSVQAKITYLKVMLKQNIIMDFDTKGYDLLLMAIYKYNNNEFEEAIKFCDEAKNYFNRKKMSYLEYIHGLSCLALNDEDRSMIYLRSAVRNNEDDEGFYLPYIIMAQIQFDNNKYVDAQHILYDALRNNEKNYELNNMMGNALFAQASYKKAIQYYETAYDNTSNRELESLNALQVAKCFKQLKNTHGAQKWLDKGKAKLLEGAHEYKDEMARNYMREYDNF
jgi:tetratricopeptide (TPR) repeat protein